MFGIKHRKELKKEIKEENLTPTKDLKVDETNLSEEEKEHTSFPWTFLIIGGSILILMIVAIVIIFVTGGPFN